MDRRQEFLSVLKKEGILYREDIYYYVCGSYKYQRILEPRYIIKLHTKTVYDEKNDHYLELTEDDFELINKAVIKWTLKQ